MTVAAKPATISYIEDGVSVSFAVPFRFKAASDLVVERLSDGNVVALQLGTDFTVTGGATDAGGTLTRTLATNGATLRITRSTARAQPMTYATGDRFPAASHEDALDRQMLVAQEQDAAQADTVTRAVMVPPGETIGDLPKRAERVGIVVWDPDTRGFGAAPIVPGLSGAAPIILSSRALLAAVASPVDGQAAEVTEPVMGGPFTFRATDLSGGVADDPAMAFYVPPIFDLSGHSGAWVRQQVRGIAHMNLSGGLISAGSFLNALPLFADNYGVVDDINAGLATQVDQTAAAQAFVALCASRQRTAHFGGLRVGTTGTVRSHSTPIVFDNLGNVTPQPGFYPRDLGTRYWAVIMTGACPGTKIAVRGRGTYEADGNGNKIFDTRTRVNGVLFGAEKAGDPQFFLSVVDSVYVNDLAGIGVRRELVHDCTFSTITVERCGDIVNATPLPAFADTAEFGTVNETVTTRLQVELAFGQAILIHPNTLSCTYTKIHSEGLAAVAGVPGWILGGGQNVFDAPRLDATGTVGRANISGAVQIIGPRFENIVAFVSGANETLNIIGGGGTFRPLEGATGRMNFVGVTGDWLGLSPGFNLDGCTINTLEIGYNPDPTAIKVSQSSIVTLRPIPGETQASASFSSCAIASWTPLAAQLFTNGTVIGMTTATIGYCTVRLYDSTLSGNVSLDTAFLDAKGAWKIDGNLNFAANAQSLFDDGGYVTGTVTGFSFPVAAQYLRHYRGMYCANLAPATGQPSGWKCTAEGAPGPAQVGTWRPLANVQ